jgi:PKD repeat protein
MRIDLASFFRLRSAAGLLFGFVTILTLSGCPFAGPSAAFMASPTEGDAPLAVNFIDQSMEGGSDITTWLWDFGDGTQSAEQNPAHTYTKSGFFRVTLRVTSNTGTSTETKDAFIEVRAVPTAAFSASPQQGNTPLTVQFQDDSTADPFQVTAWRWTFGDGEVSTERNPAHVYTQPGSYNVSLTVTSDGGTGSETKNAFIVVAELPTVTFDASTTTGPAPLQVMFTDTTVPGSAPITAWTWVFGDGGTSTEQNPAHVFERPGIYSVSLTTRTAAGEVTGTVDNLVTVTQAPVAAFSGSPTTGGAPLVVSFSDQSVPGSSPITEWLWDFGDGTSSVQRSPIHEFAEAGVFDISLTVTTAAGTDTITKLDYINAQAGPTAAFNASTLRGTAPLTVEFTDESTPGAAAISGRQWSFGDSNISGELNPVHVYSEPGIYTVSLLVQSASGSNIHVEPAYIEVVATPDASFSALPTAGESPLTVVFTDTSIPGTSPITSWLWDFGDGTTSDMEDPTRVYTTVGTYTVSLTVSTEEGADTEIRESLIVVREQPVADFSADVVAGPAPLTVQFRDASDPGSESITGRTWDFGDGTTSSAEDPPHTYNMPGIYTVTLNLATTSGPVSERKVDYVVVDPAVSFDISADSDRAPSFVTFTDTSNLGSLTVLSRLWDFGDGGTSEVIDPVHQYTSPGSYDVSLTLTTAQGEAIHVQAGAVNLRPTPAFSGEPLSGAGGPFSVQFTDLTDPGTLGISGWDWNFGDGEHSELQNPVHAFAEPGLYAVSLTILTDIGNSTVVRQDYVSVRPEAAFSADAVEGEDSLAVNFSDETDPGNLSILSWEWTLGDGGASTVQNPSHTYTTPGTYTVELRINSSEGADTETKTGYIRVTPRIVFTADVLSGDPPLDVTFADTTDPGTLEITARAWNVGDGDPIEEDSPTFTYAMPGLYDVALTITTSQGEKTGTEVGFIEVLPILSATATVTMGTGMATVEFSNDSDLGNLSGPSWLWDFGDGSTSTDEAPTHNFTSPGSFDVTLTVTTAEGVTATTVVTTVVIDPIPSLSATPTSGTVPLTVLLSDTSAIGNLMITDWMWNPGDGTGTVTTQTDTYSHTYTAPGNYTPTVEIVTAGGSFQAALPTPVAVNPDPVFSADVRSGPGTFTVTFSDDTVGGGVNITSRAWDFGDGDTATTANDTVTHTYSSAGSYDVTLVITTDTQGNLTKGETGFVTAHPLAFSVSGGNSGSVPHAITVTNTTTGGDLPILATAWDYGDGSAATPSPNHTYTDAGSYTISMTISTVQGSQTLVGTTPIIVTPVVTLTSDVTAGPGVLDVVFTDTSAPGTVNVTGRMWDFGDGMTMTVAAPTTTVSHQYTNTGSSALVRSATLTLITDIGNVASTTTQDITIHPINFSGDATNQPHNLMVNFTDATSTGDLTIASRDWDFKDGGSATTAGNTASHTYTAAGSYDVGLTITTSQGNMATGTISSDILVRPVVTYAATSALQGPKPHTVNFQDQTVLGNLTGVSRRWTWGDGSTSVVSGANTSHAFTTAGCFDTTMELLTDQGTFSDNSLAVRSTAEEVTAFTPGTTGNNSQAGIMFDLAALKNLTVRSFTVDFSGSGSTNSVRSYASPVTSFGIETNPASWTFLNDVSVTSGTGVTIDIPDIAMVTGNRFAYYILNRSAGSTNHFIRYQTGTGNTSFNDGNIRVFTNAGRTVGSANDFDGAIFAPRWFVGSVSYIHEVTCNLKSGGLAQLSNEYEARLGEAGDGNALYPSLESVVPTATTPDGGYVAIGQYSLTKGDAESPLLIRADENLEVLWELDLTGFAFDEVRDVRALPNGDLILNGSTTLNGVAGELLLVRLDESGNLLWEQVLDGVPEASLRALSDTANGEVLALTAIENADGSFVPVLYRLDAYSNILWVVEMPASFNDINWGVFERGDGSIEVYGSGGKFVDDTDVWSVGLDGDGYRR